MMQKVRPEKATLLRFPQPDNHPPFLKTATKGPIKSALSRCHQPAHFTIVFARLAGIMFLMARYIFPLK